MFNESDIKKERIAIIVKFFNKDLKIFYLDEIYNDMLNLNLTKFCFIGWTRSDLSDKFYQWVCQKLQKHFEYKIQHIHIKLLWYHFDKNNINYNKLLELYENSITLYSKEYANNI